MKEVFNFGFKRRLNSVFKNLRKNEGASGYITLMVLMLVAVMISTVVFEYLRIKEQLSTIERSLENALVSYATDNWDEIYKSAREGYSGGYKLEDEKTGNWIEHLDSDKIRGELISELKLNFSMEKIVTGDTAYKIKKLDTYLQNVSFKDKTNNLYIVSEATVTVPIITGFKSSPAFEVTIKAKSRYQNKF